MNKKIWIKKTMSLLLVLTTLMSLTVGVAQGPGAKAVNISELGKISLKMCSFDARGEDYSDISSTKIYNDDPVSLVFKKQSGCRIPKGSYVRVFYKTDYLDYRSDGYYPWNMPNAKYYTTNKLGSNKTQVCLYWKNPWKAGNYVICLIVPCSNNAGKTGYTWFSWSAKVNRYG